MKDSIESNNVRFDQAEGRMCELEDRNFETIQRRKKKKEWEMVEESIWYYQKKEPVNY